MSQCVQCQRNVKWVTYEKKCFDCSYPRTVPAVTKPAVTSDESSVPVLVIKEA